MKPAATQEINLRIYIEASVRQLITSSTHLTSFDFADECRCDVKVPIGKHSMILGHGPGARVAITASYQAWNSMDTVDVDSRGNNTNCLLDLDNEKIGQASRISRKLEPGSFGWVSGAWHWASWGAGWSLSCAWVFARDLLAIFFQWATSGCGCYETFRGLSQALHAGASWSFWRAAPVREAAPPGCLVAGSLGAYGASFLGTLKISFSATHSSHCWFVGSRHFILIDRKRTHTNQIHDLYFFDVSLRLHNGAEYTGEYPGVSCSSISWDRTASFDPVRHGRGEIGSLASDQGQSIARGWLWSLRLWDCAGASRVSVSSKMGHWSIVHSKGHAWWKRKLSPG